MFPCSAVAESAAVGMNHAIKGEAVYCFVTLREGFEWNDKIINELKLIGESAFIHFLV